MAAEDHVALTGALTPRYITKKSPRNVQHGVLETSLTISRVFSKFEDQIH